MHERSADPGAHGLEVCHGIQVKAREADLLDLEHAEHRTRHHAVARSNDRRRQDALPRQHLGIRGPACDKRGASPHHSLEQRTRADPIRQPVIGTTSLARCKMQSVALEQVDRAARALRRGPQQRGRVAQYVGHVRAKAPRRLVDGRCGAELSGHLALQNSQ